MRTGVFLVVVNVVLALVLLPIAYYSGYVLPRAFDLGRQTPRAWAIDWLKGTLVGAALGTLIGAGFLWSVLSWPENWWWIFGGLATLVGLVLVFATPYVLVPLFFKMQPLA